METNTKIKTKPIEVNPSNVHIFEDDNRYFLLVVPTSHFFEVDKMTYNFLELLQQDGYTYEKVQNELIKHYKKEKLEEVASELKETLVAPDMPKKKPPTDYSIKNIMFNVTQCCNLRCIYCYGGDGSYGNPKHMTKKIAKQSVDFFASKMKEGQIAHINFFGGEPLMNFELIKYVVEYSKKIAEEEKIKFTYGMTTNGTLLTDEVIDYLEEKEINVMISMDGGKEIQDRNRPLTNNRSSFDMMYSRIKKYIGIKKRVTARASITSGMSIKKTVEQLTKIGFGSIFCTPITAKKEKSFALTKKEYSKLGKEIEEISKNQMEKGTKSEFASFAGFRRNLEEINDSLVRKFPCGAGKGLIGLDVDGNLYLCHRFVGESKFIIGNIFHGFDKEKRTEYIHDIVDNEDRKPCNICWARYLCGGGCYHNNFIETGNAKIPSQMFCMIQKNRMIQSLKQYINISNSRGISLVNIVNR